MRFSGIDEFTTEGSSRVLKDLVFDQLALAAACLTKCLLFVCGDQLTIYPIRKLKIYLRKMKTPVERGLALSYSFGT